MNDIVTEKRKSITGNMMLKPKEVPTQTLATGKKDVEESKEQIPLIENQEALPDTVNRVLNAYKKRVELYKNFNAMLMDSIKETAGTSIAPAALEKILKLVSDNFEVSLNVMDSGMKSIIETYSKHISLTLDINQKFSDNITTQFQLFKTMQQNSASFYSNLTRKWWKENSVKQIG